MAFAKTRKGAQARVGMKRFIRSKGVMVAASTPTKKLDELVKRLGRKPSSFK